MKPSHSVDIQSSWYRKLHDLMPYRIREVLLVSSPYDAFTLEQDGRLTERLFARYSELNLSSAPRITHATSGSKAMEIMARRCFDLVITMVRLEDMDVYAFGREVKKQFPNMPVVLLAFTEAELVGVSEQSDTNPLDRVFLWTGDTRILLSIIKQIEDTRNAPYDTSKGGVRVILVVEDSIRRYSIFLSQLYEELMVQSHSLIEEGLNDLHKLMRMRTRPKILLANDYERAEELFSNYSEYIFALVTDVRFPKNGAVKSRAGFDFVKEVQKTKGTDFPILVQSSEPENAVIAKSLGVTFANKNSDTFLGSLHDFLQQDLGFGDFVFRMPDGREVARARSMYEMEKIFGTIPGESLMEHARKNHFSRWLMARSMFDLAKQLKKQSIKDFASTEDLRETLLSLLRNSRLEDEEGTIIDFQATGTPSESPFIRLGAGSIGGKARSIAFANTTICRHEMEHRFGGLSIRIPKTIAIGSGEFQNFLDTNPQLQDFIKLKNDSTTETIDNYQEHCREPVDGANATKNKSVEGYGNKEKDKVEVDEQTLIKGFLEGKLPEPFVKKLRLAFKEITGPIAVRSSSLLEDSHFQPFAGIYSTYILPNNHESKETRFRELSSAIKAVYASTFSRNAREYISQTPHKLEEERMGVVIQEMVGQRHEDLFYPIISGVALAHNYYPRGYQKSEEGIVMASLGLGHTIVLGGSALQFSPSTPQLLPQYASPKDMVKHSQTSFLALDMNKTVVDFLEGTESSLSQQGLERAEKDGNLDMVGSIYDPAGDRIRDNFNRPGPRVISFNNILRWNAIPLAPALEELLKLFRHGMGCPVEIEFAVDRGDYARSVPRGHKRREPCLYVLQVRPQARLVFHDHIKTEGFPKDQILCHTQHALGHGVIDTIKDIVYIKSSTITSFDTPKAAGEVGKINKTLRAEKRPSLIIGPGRWGTTDPGLGIPVQWGDITSAKVIIETDFNDKTVEPSQGSHFFHNITSFQIGYLTLTSSEQETNNYPSTEDDFSPPNEGYLDRIWLDSIPATHETNFVRHVRLDHPLRVLIDGLTGNATVIKPE